jgi:uncharacterized protein YegP (UPF0339 family)
MNLIWRFYRDQNRHWRRQLLAFNHDIIAQLAAGYNGYEDCVEEAGAKIYVSLPSQSVKVKASEQLRRRW